MSRARPELIARACAGIAGLAMVVCVAILLADYVVARVLTPRDDKRIADLQEQVKTDATLAPKLEADHKAITGRRLGRKARGKVAAWVLIACGAIFLSSAKWLLGLRGRQPVAMSKLVPAKPRKASATRASPAARPTPPSAAPAFDLQFVDEIVAKQGRGKEAVIPILQAIQSQYRSLPYEALARVCELTEITPAQIEGTASLYARFRLPGRQATRPRPQRDGSS